MANAHSPTDLNAPWDAQPIDNPVPSPPLPAKRGRGRPKRDVATIETDRGQTASGTDTGNDYPSPSLPSRETDEALAKAIEPHRGHLPTYQETDTLPSSPPPPSGRAQRAEGERGERGRGDEGGFDADPLPVRRGLPIAIKREMVELFATFHRVTDVRTQIAQTYGIVLDSRTVQSFDCGSRHGRVGKALRKHFDAVRKAYLERSSDVAIAHRGHRLRMIQTIVEKAQTAKDFGNAIKGLELAAKEMGGVLDGKSEVVHRGVIEHRHMSIEDAKAELAMRLREAVDGGVLQALPKPDEPTP